MYVLLKIADKVFVFCFIFVFSCGRVCYYNWCRIPNSYTAYNRSRQMMKRKETPDLCQLFSTK